MAFRRRSSKQPQPPTFPHPHTPNPPASASRAPCHLWRAEGPSSSPNLEPSVRRRRRQSACRRPSRQIPNPNPVVRELWVLAVRGSQRLLTIPLHSRNTTTNSVSVSLTFFFICSSPADLSSRTRVRCPGRYGRRRPRRLRIICPWIHPTIRCLGIP